MNTVCVLSFIIPISYLLDELFLCSTVTKHEMISSTINGDSKGIYCLEGGDRITFRWLVGWLVMSEQGLLEKSH